MRPKVLGRRTTGSLFRSTLAATAAAIVAGAIAATPARAVVLPAAPVITRAFAGPAVGAVGIGWAPATNGGSSITTYGFSVSVNGGSTWSAVQSFKSKNLFQSTLSFPSLACANTAAGSKGCLFRIHAANVLGFGAPSKPVALWAAPTAPRSLVAYADPDFNTTALTWKVPAADGGLPITGYDVLGSMDGAAPNVLTTVLGLGATVPCPAARTCAYSVRAINSHGKSPVSGVVTVSPVPGPPQGLELQNRGSDPATGRSVLHLAWDEPLTGLPADHYDIQLCGRRVGVAGSCDPSSSGWTQHTQVFPMPGGDLTADGTCQAGFATCLMRVRAVNARGGAGAWRAIDIEPWAPYSVTVSAGPARGSVTVLFLGPAESGRRGTAAKHYRVLVCDTVCNVTSNWRTASDAVPYPPHGSPLFLAGSFACRPPPTGPPHPRQCQVRMQFVDGLGDAGILSAAGVGPERP